MNQTQERFIYFDGLRGIAALLVLVHHIFYIFFPVAFLANLESDYPFVNWFSAFPFYLLINGKFWVAVFFLLSAYVISHVASRSQESLSHLIGRRYLRLTVPMVFSVLFAYLCLAVFPSAVREATSIIPNSSLESFYSSEELVPLHIVIWDAIYNCYQFGRSYMNPVLWTMKIELFGSIALYCCYRLTNKNSVRFLYLLAIPAIIYYLVGKNVYFIGFCFGGLIYEFRNKLIPLKGMCSFIFILLGLFLGSYPIELLIDLAPFKQVDNVAPIIESIGAAFLLVGLLSSNWLQKFLSLIFFQWLGKISFSLYLLHWPVLIILGTNYYTAWLPQGGELIFFLAGLTLFVLLLSWGVTNVLEQPLVRYLTANKSMPGLSITRFIALLAYITAVIIYGQRVGYNLLLIVILGCMGASFYFVLNVFFKLSILKKSSAV